jgi:hypothetical protein
MSGKFSVNRCLRHSGRKLIDMSRGFRRPEKRNPKRFLPALRDPQMDSMRAGRIHAARNIHLVRAGHLRPPNQPWQALAA